MDLFEEIILVLLGGVCASLGGFAARWYGVRTAGDIRCKETLGEQKAKALGRTARIFSNLSSVLIQGAHKDVLDFIKEHNEWMLDNEAVLPQKVAENWHSVRSNVRSLMRKDGSRQHMTEGPELDALIEEIVSGEDFTRQLAKEAEQLIRDELILTPFKIHRWARTSCNKAL
jgi:hypothetical protein